MTEAKQLSAEELAERESRNDSRRRLIEQQRPFDSNTVLWDIDSLLAHIAWLESQRADKEPTPPDAVAEEELHREMERDAMIETINELEKERDELRDAKRDVWEQAARIVEGFDASIQLGRTDAYCIAAALRSHTKEQNEK